MKSIIFYEIKKIAFKPSIIILFILILILNLSIIIFDESGNLIDKDYNKHLKNQQGKYKGKIDQDWIQSNYDDKRDLISNPDNFLAKKEQEEIKNKYLQYGYNEEYIDNLERDIFLKEEVTSSLNYIVLSHRLSEGNFYENAKERAEIERQYYLNRYEGKKGQALANKSYQMYSKLADDYGAYYDYDHGWFKLVNLQKLIPLSLGVFLIISLARVFSSEYMFKTDSILLSCKYGKSRLVYGKIIAAFLFSIISWLIIQIFNLVLVYLIFGLEGSASHVQDWVFNASPWPYTQLENYLIVRGLSFLGLIFMTSIILLVSVRSKKTYSSLIVSGIILLFPAIFNINLGEFLNNILFFMPVEVLIGANHLTFFKAYYILGRTILLPQAVTYPTILVIGLVMPLVFESFKKRQVEN